MSSQIASFYSNKSVLLTGATGFLGKVLLEKLLRACPDIKCVYVLIRVYRDKSPVSRLDDLLNSQAFDRLRHENPEALKKIVCIAGDMTKPGLSISSEDKRHLSAEVSVVFNLAARIKFDYHLKEAVNSNVKGPLELVKIARSFKNLMVFVHVSTAYCRFNEDLIEEIIPEADYDTLNLVQRIDSMTTENDFCDFVKTLLIDQPNVYGYTKSLAEQLLARECKTGFPLVVVKPSVVIASACDPYPGWVDTYSGGVGLIAGIGKGIVQVFRCVGSVINDSVPVDFTANIIIATAWSHVSNNFDSLEIYNYSNRQSNPFLNGEGLGWVVRNWRKNPFINSLWYPNCVYYSSWLPYYLSLMFNHFIPAFFIDLFTLLSGKKPYLTKLYKKIHKEMNALTPYTTVTWNFKTENQAKLFNKMSVVDQTIFDFDISKLDWDKYSEVYCLGIRKYLFKEDTCSLGQARKRLKRKQLLQIVFRFFVCLFAIGLVMFVGC